MAARLHGRITQWFDDRGYGFITAAGGTKQVFLHISALSARGVRPKPGDAVTFLLDRDAEGRLRAKAVQYAGAAATASTTEPIIMVELSEPADGCTTAAEIGTANLSQV